MSAPITPPSTPCPLRYRSSRMSTGGSQSGSDGMLSQTPVVEHCCECHHECGTRITGRMLFQELIALQLRLARLEAEFADSEDELSDLTDVED